MTEVANRAETNRTGGHEPRRWPWIVGVIVLVVVLVAVAVVFLAPDAADEPEPTAAPNTAEAIRTDLVDETVYDGTLGTTEDDALVAPIAGVVSFAPSAGATVAPGEVAFAIDEEPVVVLAGDTAAYRSFQLSADSFTVGARSNGTVTSLVELGVVLEQGDVLARLDGEPVVVLYGDIPMYRTLQDLSDNQIGEDVRQLEQALTDLGYNDGDVTVDDEFTQTTQDMVEAWQDDIGVDDDGVVTVADVVFVPGPAQVVALPSAVGDRVADGTPLAVVTNGPSMSGADVEQLERALADLGFDADGTLTVDQTFDANSVQAIRQLQEAIGATPDGLLGAGEVRFSETAVKVTEVNAEVGTTVAAGTPVLKLSSPDKIVTFDLPAADQDLVAVGDSVSVELPSGEEVPGTVSFVAETATTSVDQQTAVFEIEVTLDDPSVAADLEQAPVDVSVTSDSVSDVVAVPVSALLALAEGGYAVEIVDADGERTLVRVEPGFYAGGFVEVESDRVTEGTEVVVP